MYTVCVRSHFMIAHSFEGAVFGPAQRMHGATYTVDAEFSSPKLGDDGIVVDIGRASTALQSVLGELNFRNLDEVTEFEGKNTTTEFLARVIFDRVSQRIRAGELGPGSEGLTRLRIVLHESHVAWAAFEGSLRDG
ncbi:MAG TPA: 6-carboxytetrahydropterin synthase [Gammaproteobacteria bacterium]|jgi:6-pyruvoyl-tetrahydropterin synthase